MLGFIDEGREALIAAALDAPDAALDAWLRWERSGGSAATDLVARRWLPLIAWNLRHARLDAASTSQFREAQRAIWASNARITAVARPALDALHAHGVPTILLKGAALIHQAYGGLNLRALGDVDILVKPAHGETAQRVLADLGWQPSRQADPRDRLLIHGFDLRRPPHGVLDVHWYLLCECCWPEIDGPLWQRARPLPEWGVQALALSPADQLMHVCLHGLRWSPVHGGYWIADAVRIIASAGPALDWTVLVEESRRRDMTVQMLEALRVVKDRGHATVPDDVMETLAKLPAQWYERWECRSKGRPVVSAAGLFVTWAGWHRTSRAARAAGVQPPSWLRYLAASMGLPSSSAVAARLARHAWDGVAATMGARPTRGATTRERLRPRRELS